jgi:hypothetical protein
MGTVQKHGSLRLKRFTRINGARRSEQEKLGNL